MVVIAPVGRFGSFGLDLGQQNRSEIIAEAITNALSSYRLQTFPLNPENPWRIPGVNFTELVDRALDYSNDVGSVYEFSYSRQEIAAALIARGYVISEISPFTLLPIERPIEPLIYLPEAPPATIRTVTVTIQPPVPAIIQPPAPPAPVIQLPEVRAKADGRWIWIVGAAALLVSGQKAA